MHRKFIESKSFRRDWCALGLGDIELRALEDILLTDPEAGSVIQHTGGARKIRVAFPNKGKSGSGRVIYIDAVVKDTIYLIAVYAKNVQENLNEQEKKIIRELVKRLKGE